QKSIHSHTPQFQCACEVKSLPVYTTDITTTYYLPNTINLLSCEGAKMVIISYQIIVRFT
ncbi:MAG: hypothetical protein MJE68_02670, partial [Proteobacteria bacterium]|nr:hypothetical protein [Pseudomonadota bacterium]